MQSIQEKAVDTVRILAAEGVQKGLGQAGQGRL